MPKRNHAHNAAAVLVPGLRTPGVRRSDVAVFGPLAHQLTKRCDPAIGAGDVLLHVPRGRSRRAGRLVPYAATRRHPPTWSFRAPLDTRAADVAASLTTFVRTHPGREVVLVGYSIGGNAALMALGRLPGDVIDHVAGVVTLAAPFRGLLESTLAETFGPPMLDRGIPWLLRGQRVFAPGLDCAAAASAVAAGAGVPVLNVAVEGDPVAPPASALIGVEGTAPPNVEWLRVTPRHPRPEGPWRTPADLPAALTVLGGVHSEVVLRRDVLAAVGKFVDAARIAGAG